MLVIISFKISKAIIYYLKTNNIISTMNLITNLNFLSLVLLVSILFSSSFLALAADGGDYGYIKGTSNGPENWGNLNPDWKVCGDGKQQSPIDIIDASVQESPQLGKLEKVSKAAPSVLKNNGRDIMVLWTGDAGNLKINGTVYNMVQCHWHSPSEHTLNGLKFDLELHAVHKNAQGGIAVIGIWYKTGGPDFLLSKLLDSIKASGNKDIDLGVLDPADFYIGSGEYYRYGGSVTSPPCTEGVTWTVMKEVRTVSMDQLNALKGAVKEGYKENARPIQKIEGRQVLLYKENPSAKPT